MKLSSIVNIRISLLPAALLGLGLGCTSAQETTSVIADFEGPDYGAWKTSGTAFGAGPARGTLPNQMPVEGFNGQGLVNSFHGGDDATGTLTSPPFKLERAYLQFLIGGGGWEGRTCLNLLVDGAVVRTAEGPNTQPGGSERLTLQQWDVSEYRGRNAVLQIVDQATGSWGHINVDQIVQTDRKVEGLAIIRDAQRSFQVTKRYLNLPVKTGAPKRRLNVSVDGKTEREFEIELAPAEPDFWTFLDLTPFQGKEIIVKVARLPENTAGWQQMEQANEIRDTKNLYRETLRPQFHFTSRRGWLNDPNGLVFYQGEYHLFYQHNPYGWNWGNMHWGHAVSKDLVRWKELPIALYPDQHGTMFSGSAVVDWNNTAGFQTGREPALVAMFTAAGKPFTQGLAFSNDRGRTWTKYAGNPVLGHLVHENRDPKVVWFAPEKKWVMALYLDHNDYALFASRDLKQWEKLSDVKIPGDSECPEFFEMPVDGNAQNTRWVFYGANGRYLVGKFDGKTFTPESGPHALHHGNCWYASQTFNDLPAADGRRVLVPWGRMTAPDVAFHQNMPFNQMMGLPVELTLTGADGDLRLRVQPIRELASLRGKTHRLKPQDITPGQNPLAKIKAELFDLTAELAVGNASEIRFTLRGVPVVYNVVKQELSCAGSAAPLVPVNGKIKLRLLVDRTSIDIFGGDGRLYLPMGLALPTDNRTLELASTGGTARILSLEVSELKSAWK